MNATLGREAYAPFCVFVFKALTLCDNIEYWSTYIVACGGKLKICNFCARLIVFHFMRCFSLKFSFPVKRLSPRKISLLDFPLKLPTIAFPTSLKEKCSKSPFPYMSLYAFITCRAKLLNADWLRQRAFFLNQEGTFGNQEGMIT